VFTDVELGSKTYFQGQRRHRASAVDEPALPCMSLKGPWGMTSTKILFSGSLVYWMGGPAIRGQGRFVLKHSRPAPRACTNFAERRWVWSRSCTGGGSKFACSGPREDRPRRPAPEMTGNANREGNIADFSAAEAPQPHDQVRRGTMAESQSAGLPSRGRTLIEPRPGRSGPRKDFPSRPGLADGRFSGNATHACGP